MLDVGLPEHWPHEVEVDSPWLHTGATFWSPSWPFYLPRFVFVSSAALRLIGDLKHGVSPSVVETTPPQVAILNDRLVRTLLFHFVLV